MFPSLLLGKNTIQRINREFFTTAKVCVTKDKILGMVNPDEKGIYEHYAVLKRVRKKNTLTESLKRFREIVQKETKRKGYNFYCGWPPRDRIKITNDEKLGHYGRTIFVFNRVKGISEQETNLCICCKNKNIIFFNKSEFESLLKNMDSIKHQLQEFAKKI
ncbi:conserved Plasmodium protein, unknown function [Plasmodium ovale]|uniref:Uncharacterized protein n=2 Tax=Plasmodium ovale TaxID=36330 RepID=A0A1C3KVA3_PLAOA|nr:conserved Plasmodium protein, unknown function [Plasmodium ovale]